jgi:hypothetical protein
VTVEPRRAALTHLAAEYLTSERRACRVIGLARSRCQYASRRPTYEALRTRLRELAALRPRWGYQRLHILLRREGVVVNDKLVLRLYRERHRGVTPATSTRSRLMNGASLAETPERRDSKPRQPRRAFSMSRIAHRAPADYRFDQSSSTPHPDRASRYCTGAFVAE